ncbi:hypothetical protein, variant [Exophiala dermatitidis NIH/UT8656]|uniref:Uncharacterized protein n=1 Tax=Exophiala dermatitidis (strain ATCC 34100 / CBS 525.76 / NIH/UT8656) TaxID=858893 RepID=H6BZG6_EXODN|nr:uncharacterized protein HMPREF1120_05082 [Exophiala dermatitidis NIH/UT8656]XP_009157491.1 hypothetical protein, variant [Exophiala dermatitidis NIH/UT8656]EHY57029.1 hypothetical protein, variant [Exophiala dermatitidis NIH/UT8656]EHY57030.1 hypothetical protein HMPREF1120_05082 [Exophiala dermatitidis NIH/UT8656]
MTGCRVRYRPRETGSQRHHHHRMPIYRQLHILDSTRYSCRPSADRRPACLFDSVILRPAPLKCCCAKESHSSALEEGRRSQCLATDSCLSRFPGPVLRICRHQMPHQRYFIGKTSSRPSICLHFLSTRCRLPMQWRGCQGPSFHARTWHG